MKKLILSMVFVFAMSPLTLINASTSKACNSNISVEMKYPDCWAAADAAEINTCGHVGCNFDLWVAVYTACQNK